MHVITATKSCALHMEYNLKEIEAETIRQNVRNMLQKYVEVIRSNLTENKRRTLKELQNNGKFRLQEFVKGCGLAIATDNTAKGKMEEQLSKSAKTKIDPTSRLTKRFRKNFANLEK